MGAARWLAVVGLAVMVGACETPAESFAPSDTPIPSDRAPTSALSFCDPLNEIVLRAPNGRAVDIRGEWTAVTVYPGDTQRVFVRQVGDCVWLVDMLFPTERGGEIWGGSFHGRLATDFRIRGEFADVYPGFSYPGDEWTYGPLTYQIVFNGNDVELVEERTADPPGCGSGPGSCPSPIHWVRR